MCSVLGLRLSLPFSDQGKSVVMSERKRIERKQTKLTDDWNDKEAVCIICNAGQRVVPCEECREEAEVTSCFVASRVWTGSRGIEISNTEQKKGKVQGEEEEEEGEGRLERAEKENGGEDEPTLKLVSSCLEHLLWG